MAEQIEVKPRYFEEPAHEPTPQPLAVSTPETPTRGLFTSIYENKIIVLIVVISVLIIGVLAYVFLRKSDPPEPPRQHAPPQQHMPPPVPQAPQQLPPQAPQQQPQPMPQQPAPQPEPTRMVADSAQIAAEVAAAVTEKNAAIATVEKQLEAHAIYNRSKKEEYKQAELRAMLEKARAPPTPVVEESDEYTDEEESDNEEYELVDEPEPADDSAASAAAIEPSADDSGTCTAIVSTGRRCKVKVKNGTRCSRHAQ